MRIRFPLVAFVLSASLVGCAPPETAEVGSETYELDPQDLHGKPEPPMLGAHRERGEAGRTGGGTRSPNMTLHGGNVMAAVTIQPIFWGTSWASSSFTGDKITGLDQLYAAYAGSGYARTNTEYTGTNGQRVTAINITVEAQIVDATAAPRTAPKSSAILAEVCKKITNPSANGYYPVYTDTPRGSAGYCAWHSWGQCNGVNVQFGFFFKLDGDSGCDPQDTTLGRSQGLAALANVSGHELSEMVTDPRGTGWTDSSGNENADKCAWVFTNDGVTLSDGSIWRIQGNWSNAAYTAGTGSANSSGQKGCLYSSN